jgi:thiol-disulfide isomerase/thioredoxin
MAAALATLAAATAAPGTVEVALTRTVANIEYSRAGLLLAPVVPGPLPLPAVSGRAWHGGIPRRLPEEVPSLGHDHFVPFMVDYVDGKPLRAWCDQDLDGDLTDQPPLVLNAYPAIAGARSFLAAYRWRTRAGSRSFDAERTIRVVLEPMAPGPPAKEGDAPAAGDPSPETSIVPPSFRLQSVFAMTGTADLEGRTYPIVLFDGDGDGVYSRSLFDGVYVDVDRDGHLVIDQMGPEFASFEASLDAGGRAWVIGAVESEGRGVTLRSAGPASARASAPAIGAPAPDFTITATDGRPIRLSALRGRPVLVYFWTSTCHTCLDQAESLVSLYERFRPAGLEIVGISYDTDRAAFDAFRAQHHEVWPTSFSGRQVWEDPVGRIYRQRGTGVLNLVDAYGTLVLSTSRVADVEAALSRRSPPSNSRRGHGAPLTRRPASRPPGRLAAGSRARRAPGRRG